VKSSITFRSVENVIMAIRSEAVIWVCINFRRRSENASVLDGHSRQVEEHHQQAAVLVLDLAGLAGAIW